MNHPTPEKQRELFLKNDLKTLSKELAEMSNVLYPRLRDLPSRDASAYSKLFKLDTIEEISSALRDITWQLELQNTMGISKPERGEAVVVEQRAKFEAWKTHIATLL